VERLDIWLNDARASGIYGMRRFVRTLRQDIEAVRNAVLEPWSNGQTEGHCSRCRDKICTEIEAAPSKRQRDSHDAGRGCPPADHAPGVRLCHRLLGQLGGAKTRAGAEQPALAVLGDARGGDFGVQRFGKRMMARHLVMLAAFFVQPQLPAGALRPHSQHGGDGREQVRVAINARSRRSRTVSVAMLSMSLRHSAASSTGVLPVFTTCFGPRTAPRPPGSSATPGR
jgi:hypothetical protein